MFNVKICSNNCENLWSSFVFTHKSSTFYHTFVWGKILEEGKIGSRLYFTLEKNGEIIGIFPSFLMYRPIRHIMCLPLSDYASPLFLSDKNESALFLQMLRHIQHKMFKCSALYLSFGLPPSLINQETIKLKRHLSSYNIRLNTENKSPDFIWKNTLTKKRRNSIRKAINMNLKVKEGKTLKDFVEYYRLHISKVRRLGLDPINFEIFRAIYKNLIFGRDYLLMLSYVDDIPIAGVLAFMFKNQIYLWGNESIKDYWFLHPNDLLYWKLVEYACINGFKYLNFGASSFSKKGSYFFKIHFGGEATPFYYYYWSPIPFFSLLRDPCRKLINVKSSLKV